MKIKRLRRRLREIKKIKYGKIWEALSTAAVNLLKFEDGG